MNGKTVGRPKKDGEFLNCYIRRDVSQRLTDFCKKTGLSKTASVERALLMYLTDESAPDQAADAVCGVQM